MLADVLLVDDIQELAGKADILLADNIQEFACKDKA